MRAAARSEVGVNVAPLIYRPAPGWASGQDSENPDDDGGGIAVAEAHAPADAETESAREEQRKSLEKTAWDEGLKEGFARREVEFAAANEKLREGISGALSDFVHARETYFHGVEGEVVALALAVVRKILRREAQVDPMLLSGLVRVALEKMAASHTVRMRAHPSQVAAWQEYFAQHHDDLQVVPELSGDTTLEQNCCQLETELGVTDLSLETQLKEIELGLFDLLAQRPAPHAPGAQPPPESPSPK
jgi:flagellar assembly protein FliH